MILQIHFKSTQANYNQSLCVLFILCFWKTSWLKSRAQIVSEVQSVPPIVTPFDLSPLQCEIKLTVLVINDDGIFAHSIAFCSLNSSSRVNNKVNSNWPIYWHAVILSEWIIAKTYIWHKLCPMIFCPRLQNSPFWFWTLNDFSYYQRPFEGV